MSALDPDAREYDQVVEVLRRALCSLPRYSFQLDQNGNVRRIPDPIGHWIDWQAAHELFDPEVIDSLLAKSQASAAITKASGAAS